ncbi:hypothetical protein [uncultured Tenacibaculum sp.]|uniref:hypothetical protein n=1 Tax=uncultured Tenacibaculum sp. TaxID=174713 RepID=UPI0026172C78|nr:hypothetical protein [uncultured Tenacibaculum sp.]
MKKSILNLGTVLNKKAQKEVKGSGGFPAPTEYNFCCLPIPVSAWIAEYGFRPRWDCEDVSCTPNGGGIVY